MEDKQMTQRDWINFGIIAVVVVAIVGLIVISMTSISAKKDAPLAKQEKAYADLVEAELNSYYVDEGVYPSSQEELASRFDKDSKDLSFTAVTEELEDFTYTVRGDKDAYQVSYTDNDGRIQTLSGNYKEDYN